MSIELILATLKDGPEEPVKFGRLADAVRRTVREACGTDQDVEASAEEVLVDLPGGTARICSDHALFPIEQLDPLTLRVIFDVAKTGDMVLLTEGGDRAAILVSASQRPRLPETEWQTPRASPVCRSAKQLERLLESWYRAHADFREEAVATSTSRTELDSKTRALPPSSEGKRFRWDAARDEFVEVTKDSEVVNLYRFDRAGNEVPKHPDVLRDLKDVCQQYIQAENQPHSRLVDHETWPPLSVRFSDYSADVWPARAIFTLYDLTPSVARLMFEIARTGDMSVMVPGGVILTDPGQAERVPETWKQRKRVLFCQSAEELRTLLMTLQVDVPRSERDYGFGRNAPVPGMLPSRGRIIYIEAKPKETAGKHQKKVYKHKPLSPDGPFRPEEGLLGAEFWRLETPAGQRFYAYSYGGEGWLDYLRDFAGSEDRATGSIVNFETFVQDDGQRSPVSECEVRKVDPQEL